MIQELDDIREIIFEQEKFGGYGTGVGLNHVFFCTLGGHAYAVFLAELFGIGRKDSESVFRYVLYDAERGVCIPHGTPEYDALTGDFPKTDGIRIEIAGKDVETLLALEDIPDHFAGAFCTNGAFSPAERAEYDDYLQKMRALATPSLRVLYDYFSAK